MNLKRPAFFLALIAVCSFCALFFRTEKSVSQVVQASDPITAADEKPVVAQDVLEAASPAIQHNEIHFTEDMLMLLRAVDKGQPLTLKIGETGERNYIFRPTRVTVPDFRISSSPTDVVPSSFKVYNGRELIGAGQLGEAVSMAVVNDAVSIAVEMDGVKYLVETDPSTQSLVATELKGRSHYHGVECDPVECLHVAPSDGQAPELFGMQVPDTLEEVPLNRETAVLSVAAAGDEEDEPVLEAAWVDHPYFRLGPQYDASLKDILILMVSGSTQTGNSSNLSSRAASYLTFAARVADTYERQLGLRYLLQEIVLIADDSEQDDIEYDDSVTPNNPSSGTDDLQALEDWCNVHRPQSIYGWGHAAGWTLVEGGNGGTIGWAWLDSYGSSSSAFSVQERNFDWDVHAHELGHNVGASHTSGGVMNASISNNNENFFAENASIGGYSGAMDIYNYMSSPSRNFVFGPAALRHAEEIPFGVDDAVSTPVNTAVTFSPLSNDRTSVLFGATNILRLVEVGQVFPKSAGTVEIIVDQIRFTPASGYTGNVWFSYTLSGNVGNGGLGWLHSADVVVTVGGDNTDPSLNPALSLTNDAVDTDFSSDVRINPLLNDEGSGRLWAGNVDVLSEINGVAESYSEQSFRLVGATIVSGNGTLALETVAMSRDAMNSTDNTGYIVYTPAVNELDTVVIEYTVEDEFGTQSTAMITLSRVATVSVAVDTERLIESESRVATVTFTRSPDADTSVSEEVVFSLGGTVNWLGADADVSLAGVESVDPLTLTGVVTIPAGQSSVSIMVTPFEDTISGESEILSIVIIDLESLLIDANSTVELTLDDEGSTGPSVLVEDFDAFFEPSGIGSGAGAGWFNETGELSGNETNWQVESGTTPSSGTGPSGDNTSGSGNYLYIEASSQSNRGANLVSPSFDFSGQATISLEFAYHMFGNTMGDLHIDLRTNGGAWQTDIIPVLAGQQSVDADDWQLVSVDISQYISNAVEIRFRGIVGTNFRSDICIDDLRFIGSLPDEPVSIVKQPLNQTLEVADPLYLAVAAQAFPAPEYQWKRNGVDIPGATHSAYYKASADENDSGNYTVIVTSGASVVESSIASVVVGMLSPPVIQNPPSSVSALTGDDVIFSVTATGVPSVSYQWRKDGVQLNNGNGISGVDTFELTLTGVDPGDAGNYDCIVSNSEGSVVSASASLEVSDPPLAYDQSWKDLAFGVGENGPNTDPLSDFNGDGRLNIIDYAFQIITSTPGDAVGKLPVILLTDLAGEDFAELSFRRIKGGSGDMVTAGGYSAAGINYVVEVSDTLAVGNWDTGSDLMETVGSPVDNGDETETVRVRLRTSVDAATNPKQFFRIKISEL